METPSQKLIRSLQKYATFKNQSEYQIRKTIGQDYGIPRARNAELLIALDELKETKN